MSVNISICGLAALVAMVMMTPTLADSGNAGPPLKQFQDGVPSENSDGALLPSAMATVAPSNSAYPRIKIQIPATTPMDDTLIIDIRYDYTRYGLQPEFDPDLWAKHHNYTEGFAASHMLTLEHSKHIEYVGDYEKINSSLKIDQYGEGLEKYSVILPYNGNIEHNISLEFRINGPMPYGLEIFNLHMPHSVLQDLPLEWYSSTRAGVLEISPVPPRTGQRDQYPLLRDWVLHSDDTITPPEYVGRARSPLWQFQNGVPLEEIRCTHGRVLTESPSEKPACLTVCSAQKLADRGYTMITQYWNVDGSAGNNTLVRDGIPSGAAHPNSPYPRVEMRIPIITPLEDIFRIDIKYDYTTYNYLADYYATYNHIEYNNTGYGRYRPFNPNSDHVYSHNGEVIFASRLATFTHSNHIEYVGDYEKYRSGLWVDQYGEGLKNYKLIIPYDGNIEHNISLEFRVNGTMLYDQETFDLSMKHSIYQDFQKEWYSSTNNGVLTISPISLCETDQSDQYPQRGK